MAETNYGLLLQKEDTPLAGTYTTIGKVIECGIPKISTSAVETTNHSSGGKAQQIPSGLIALSAFDAALELESASLAAVYADMEDRTIANYRVVFADTLLPMWSFAAFPLSIDAGSANSQSPGEAKVTISFQATGAMTFPASEAEGEWYDNVTALFTDVGGALTMANGSTHQLRVYAVKGGALVEVTTAQFADLTFASSVGAKATVSAFGLLAWAASGATVVTVKLTTAVTINTTINVTCSA